MEEFQVGLNYDGAWSPFAHTDSMNLEQALDTVEQAPASTIEYWNGHEWEILFDGSKEFLGVKPDNWI